MDHASGEGWIKNIPGDPVSSFDQAADQVSGFEARMPNGLGDPVQIVLRPLADDFGQKIYASLALRFESSSYGTVFVAEGAWEGPPDFGQWVQETTAKSAKLPCGATSDATTIKSGQPAMFLHDPGEPDSDPTLMWVEGQTRFQLSGPTLNRDELTAIANNV